MLLTPLRREGGAEGELPTHVRTPNDAEMAVLGEELAKEVGRRYGAPVEMMQMKHGVFDDASISVIASETVREIPRLARVSADVRVDWRRTDDFPPCGRDILTSVVIFPVISTKVPGLLDGLLAQLS